MPIPTGSALPNTLERYFRSCPFCEATCGVEVTVDRAADRVVGVRGDKLDPFSAGYLCPKSYALTELHSDPDRLRRPLLRRGGDFEEIAWDAAFDYAAERLIALQRQHGKDSVGAYLGNPTSHNPGLLLYGGALLETLGSRQVYSAATVDSVPKSLATCLMFGGLMTIAVPDIDRTQHLVVIGANPAVANGSMMVAPNLPARLRAIRARGGKIVVIDPRRTETADMADEYFPIRPGTDSYLLLAMVQVLIAEGLVAWGRADGLVSHFERLAEVSAEFPPERVAGATGIAPETIRHLARDFARAESAVMYGRTGTCTQRFGSIANWLIDGINILTGNLDRPGGAMFSPGALPAMFFADPWQGDQPPVGRWQSRVDGLDELGGLLPTAALANEILVPGEGQIRGFITIAGNILLSNPNGARLEQALSSLDFMMSVDIYVNETTRHADLILPSPSYAAHSEFNTALNGYLVRHFVKWSPPVLDVDPGGMQDWEIFCELTARLRGISAAAVEEQVVADLLAKSLAKADALCRTVDTAAARRAIGDTPGPDRLFDILLRSGRFGDAFGLRPDGLSLAALRRHEHGIDLGPLTEHLPGILSTPDRRIDLAPSRIVADVGRLRAALPDYERPDQLLLIGRRETRSKNSWMHNLHLLVKGKERCTLRIHPADARRLSLTDGSRAALRSPTGSIVVPVEISDEMMPGTVSLPHGWGHGADGTVMRIANAHQGANANLLFDDQAIDVPSVGAVLNGIPVTIEPLVD